MKIPTLRRPLRGLGFVAVLAALIAVAAAPPALAHPRLVGSTPAKGASAGSVTEVKLVFSDEVRVAEVIVRDGGGKTFQAGAAERSGTTVTQKLSGVLPAGSYTVAYRIVGEDGHPIESDDVTFTATGGALADAAAGEQPAEANPQPAAGQEESGSGAVLWVLIVAGLAAGIGIGLGIVFRAQRKYQAETGRE
ncbi:copper resistance CopC family protein [Spirillospora sp. NPDC048819]|uniref:copper resistance CopC family protein n=1 Tax=Spirillospora sp. NPDC048819 TaxID=3155268 RepID=UPI00340D80E6